MPGVPRRVPNRYRRCVVVVRFPLHENLRVACRDIDVIDTDDLEEESKKCWEDPPLFVIAFDREKVLPVLPPTCTQAKYWEGVGYKADSWERDMKMISRVEQDVFMKFFESEDILETPLIITLPDGSAEAAPMKQVLECKPTTAGDEQCLRNYIRIRMREKYLYRFAEAVAAEEVKTIEGAKFPKMR